MPRSAEQVEARSQKNAGVQQRKDREAGRNERPANPNIGKPFKRYIGGDEVQKRASNFSMFNRPPVVAPAPAGSGGENGTGAPVQPPVQNPGINPNQMYSPPAPSGLPMSSLVRGLGSPGQPMPSGPGGAMPQPPMQPPGGPMGAVTGGGNTFGQMPQVTGAMRSGIAQPMPQVPQRPMQYSLANRRFGV